MKANTDLQTASITKAERVKLTLKLTADVDRRLRDNAHVQRRDMSDIVGDLVMANLPVIRISVESSQS